MQCDRDDVSIDKSRLDEYCKQHNFIGWFATSASENVGVETAMSTLVKAILEVAKEGNSKPRNAAGASQNTVQLGSSNNAAFGSQSNAPKDKPVDGQCCT